MLVWIIGFKRSRLVSRDPFMPVNASLLIDTPNTHTHTYIHINSVLHTHIHSQVGKSSKFNPHNDEQVKSSPALKVWMHEGSYLYPKIIKNCSMGLKQGCCTGIQNFFLCQAKACPRSTSHNQQNQKIN